MQSIRTGARKASFLLLYIVPWLYGDAAFYFPAWFLFPGQGCRIVAGFTIGEQGAYENGKEKYLSYHRSSAQGHVFTVQLSPDGYFNSRDEIKFRFNRSDQIESALAGLDTLFLSAKMIICVGDTSCGIDRKTHDLSVIPEPSWIKEPLAFKNGYYYSAGSASYGVYGQSRSWVDAEREALNNLVLTMSAKVKVLDKLSRSRLLKLTKCEVNTPVSDIQVVQRWANMKYNTCWVLIRGIHESKSQGGEK